MNKTCPNCGSRNWWKGKFFHCDDCRFKAHPVSCVGDPESPDLSNCRCPLGPDFYQAPRAPSQRKQVIT